MASPDLAGSTLAGPSLAGQGRAGDFAGAPPHGRVDAGAQPHGPSDGAADLGSGYPAPVGSVDGIGERHVAEAQWAQDTDPSLDYSTDHDLDYAGDAGLDYADDDARDYPGDEGWHDMAGPGEPWGTGLAAAAGPGEDRDGDPGRSDMAGLDQLWGIGRGISGHGQDQTPDTAGRQDQDMGRGDATGHGMFGDTGPGSVRGAAGAATAPAGDMAPGERDAPAATDASAPREAGPRQALDAGSAPENGPAQDLHPARETGPTENGHGRENGSAWEGSAWASRPAPEAGSGRDTIPGPARDPGRDLPRDFGPDPLGAPGGRQTADFLSAPPPASNILTTAPRQESRTARPADVGSQTIAAELAGWAAGELPGQASARLAAWAAIGGVPAAGYRDTDGSDAGSAGVATERVR